MTQELRPVSTPLPAGPLATAPIAVMPAEPTDQALHYAWVALRAIQRWWKWALPAGILLAGALAAGVLLRFEVFYRAAAWLQIQETPTHLAYQTHDSPRRFVQNQIELIRSPLVLGPALSNPEVASLPQLQQQKDPVGWLARNLRVANVGDSEIFEVSFDSPDGQGAARLVNAIMESYLAVRNEHDSARNERMLELLEQEKRVRAQEVSRLRENVRELSKQILGKDPFTGAPAGDLIVLSHPLEDVLNKLTTAEVERKMLEVQLEAWNDSLEASVDVPDAIVTSALERHPDIQELKALIALKTRTMERVDETSVHGKNDPAYKRLEREIQRYEQSLARLRTSLRPQVKEEVATEATLRHGDGIDSLQLQIAAKKAAEDAYRQQYQERLKTAGQTGSQSLDLEFARAELAREEKVFELIAQRALALQTETRAPARVTLLKSAEVPKVPLERYPLKKLLMAIAIGLCAPLGIAVLWEHYVRRIDDAEQIGKQSSMHVVGEVARLPQKIGQAGASAHTERDLMLFEESVDSLRTCLLLGDGHADVRVIAIASAISGEGKTSVAAQLAVSIARATRQKTLLIDSDMRSPDAHQVFQIDNSIGLANCLQGDATLDEAVNTEWSEYLHVMPAGRATANPHTLVNNGRLHGLIEEARRKYAYVVIDTPPLLLASESLAVAKEADGTLLCTMRDHSRETQVKSACERLRAVGVRTLGAVLNGIPARRYAAKYGNYAYSRA